MSSFIRMQWEVVFTAAVTKVEALEKLLDLNDYSREPGLLTDLKRARVLSEFAMASMLFPIPDEHPEVVYLSLEDFTFLCEFMKKA